MLLSHHLAITVAWRCRQDGRMQNAEWRMQSVRCDGSISRIAAAHSAICILHSPFERWSERQDFHLRPRGPKPRALKTELRSDKLADPKGLAPSAFPQTTGCSGYLSYGSENGLPGRSLGEGWWEVLVMLQSSLPTFILRHRFYRPAAGTPPKIGSGGGNHTHLKKFIPDSSGSVL